MDFVDDRWLWYASLKSEWSRSKPARGKFPTCLDFHIGAAKPTSESICMLEIGFEFWDDDDSENAKTRRERDTVACDSARIGTRNACWNR